MLFLVTAYAINMLGLQSLAPVGFNLESIAMQETSNTEPVLFIISPGTDPTVELQDLANKVSSFGFDLKFHTYYLPCLLSYTL